MPAIDEGNSQRLFVGVPVPETASLSIARQLPQSLPGRQAPIGNWHFTLRFLGDAGPDLRDRLIERLSTADLGASFEISFDRLGVFPNERRAKVLWVGIGNGRERLERLAAKVETASTLAGFAPEARKFSPHLTISRMRSPESVAGVVAASRPIQAGMTVEQVILYESRMGGAHSRYAVVQAYPLDRASGRLTT